MKRKKAKSSPKRAQPSKVYEDALDILSKVENLVNTEFNSTSWNDDVYSSKGKILASSILREWAESVLKGNSNSKVDPKKKSKHSKFLKSIAEFIEP